MVSSFSVSLHRFFENLRSAQEFSPHTVAAYRDTFCILLQFMARSRKKAVDQITFDDLDADLVLAFLDHLETDRQNAARTRNARLAGIRAFVRFVLGHTTPDFLDRGQRILSIPCKRANRPMLGFLTRQELHSILAAPDLCTWTGRRDHLLFSLLYNTGARISEALRVTPGDVRNRVLRLHGKGRKERDVPLWPQTQRELRQWCHENEIAAAGFIFSNRNGQALSRRGAARRLSLALEKAAAACPSLRGRNITLHTFRHTTAMHLLQAGVSMEIIALWLGHEQINTTHAYIEADLDMKRKTLDRLRAPNPWRQYVKNPSSHILDFLEAL
jgi:integrase/recombinase XerD